MNKRSNLYTPSILPRIDNVPPSALKNRSISNPYSLSTSSSESLGHEPDQMISPVDCADEIEQEILDRLVSAWNNFIKLPQTHRDDIPDFRRAIHECQRIIAIRQMRRINPEIWPEYGDTKNGKGTENDKNIKR